MSTQFKNKGHYFNYCRKIMDNKNMLYGRHIFNVVMWAIYDKGFTQDFIKEIADFTPEAKEADNNKAFKKIAKKYGVNYKEAFQKYK